VIASSSKSISIASEAALPKHWEICLIDVVGGKLEGLVEHGVIDFNDMVEILMAVKARDKWEPLRAGQHTGRSETATSMTVSSRGLVGRDLYWA
jgi:hypothetical protein